jgi:hypothetical protein
VIVRIDAFPKETVWLSFCGAAKNLDFRSG